MGRPETLGYVTVIFTSLILVFYDQAYGHSCAHALKYTAEDLQRVVLLPLRSYSGLPRPAPRQLCLDEGLINHKTRRTTVDNYADSRPVRFTKCCYAKDFT